jgi:hypothetical protein
VLQRGGKEKQLSWGEASTEELVDDAERDLPESFRFLFCKIAERGFSGDAAFRFSLMPAWEG